MTLRRITTVEAAKHSVSALTRRGPSVLLLWPFGSGPKWHSMTTSGPLMAPNVLTIGIHAITRIRVFGVVSFTVRTQVY